MKRPLRPTKQPEPLTLVSSSWRGFWLFRAEPLSRRVTRTELGTERVADSSPEWCGNALRFATSGEAEAKPKT
jgi:hypothetical protein